MIEFNKSDVGSAKWYDLLKSTRFPSNFIFYYNRKRNIIQIGNVLPTTPIERMKWTRVKPDPQFYPEEDSMAVIDVRLIRTKEEYTEICQHYQEIWCCHSQ